MESGCTIFGDWPHYYGCCDGIPGEEISSPHFHWSSSPSYLTL